MLCLKGHWLFKEVWLLSRILKSSVCSKTHTTAKYLLMGQQTHLTLHILFTKCCTGNLSLITLLCLAAPLASSPARSGEEPGKNVNITEKQSYKPIHLILPTAMVTFCMCIVWMFPFPYWKTLIEKSCSFAGAQVSGLVSIYSVHFF